MRYHLYLHDAMLIVLMVCPKKLETPENIAQKIEKKDMWTKKNGDYPNTADIRERARKAKDWFKIDSSGLIGIKCC